MASSTPLRDMEDKFFLCSVCLDHFKEPKQLPCLHRYCSNCLQAVIQSTKDTTMKCPMCKQRCPIPKDGVEGFKTDFHMKNILEFIQLQRSFDNKHVKKCVSCLKEKHIFAYCFKCRDFLCEKCYNAHISRKMLRSHRSHTLKLDNIETKKLTLEKLAALTEDPRCHVHVKKEAHLCCSTCENVPVCVACTYSYHKGHDLHDVSKLAEHERKLLKLKLDEINGLQGQMYQLPNTILASKKHLNENFLRRTDRLNNQYKQQAEIIEDKINKRKMIRQEGLNDIEKRRTVEERQINISYEEELDELKTRYDEIRRNATLTYDNESLEFTRNCDEIDEELFRKLENLDKNFKSITTAKDLLTEQNKKKLKQISDYCDQVIERYENFTATVSSILACNDEWTDVQCIPDVKIACEALMEDMRQGFPGLKSLSDIIIDELGKVISVDVTMNETEDYVIDVEMIKRKKWLINGVTSNKDGTITITGRMSNGYSHIIVINKNSEMQRQDRIKRGKKFVMDSYRYCCSLSEFKVATVCVPDEFGIYDVRDGSYNRKCISEAISHWPDDRIAWCVATDPVIGHIVIGTNSRYVYVFDVQLNYCHTITLPDEINGARDIALHGDNLLVCDARNKRAFVVTMRESESKMIYELAKPHLDLVDWIPHSICTDKREFIYMLYVNDILFPSRSVLVQYSQDGQRLLATKEVDPDGRYVTTVRDGKSENVLVATLQAGKSYAYDLTVV